MMRAEADYSLTEQAFNNQPQNEHDKRLRVHFGLFPQLNQEKSTQEGRPIYDEVEYITIMVPGERDVVHRAAWEKDYQRFPLQYAAFKNKRNQDASSGTPLTMVTWLSAAQIKELEFFNCYTVEQLANLADSSASRFMGIQGLKQRAKDFLQAAKDSAPLLTLRTEIEKKDSQIDAMQKQMNEMAAKLNELMTKPSK